MRIATEELGLAEPYARLVRLMRKLQEMDNEAREALVARCLVAVGSDDDARETQALLKSISDRHKWALGVWLPDEYKVLLEEPVPAAVAP